MNELLTRETAQGAFVRFFARMITQVYDEIALLCGRVIAQFTLEGDVGTVLSHVHLKVN